MAKILCVEDETEILADIVDELTELGHTVRAATNGEEGLNLALSFHPEIILCDCLMPVMTGPQMIAALREQYENFNSIRFVFLSAHAEQSHQSAGLAAGADLYLTKPIDFDKLEAVLASLVDKIRST